MLKEYKIQSQFHYKLQKQALGKTFQNALQNFKKLKVKNLHIGLKHNKIGNYIYMQIRY